jgi:hypothetical protein
MAKYSDFARLLLRPDWIRGEGQFAFVSFCDGVTVELFPTKEKAMQAFETAEKGSCDGWMCGSEHMVTELPDEFPKILRVSDGQEDELRISGFEWSYRRGRKRKKAVIE